MGTPEIELEPVGTRVLNLSQNRFPHALLTGHHQRDHESAIRPVLLDLRDLIKVHLQRPVGDQLNVVETDHAAVLAVHRLVARAVHIDNGRTLFTEGLPHDAAPSRFKGTVDVVGLVGRRRRGQPERIWGLDPRKVTFEVAHQSLLLVHL